VLDKAHEFKPLDELESSHIKRAIDLCDCILSKAADMLGVTRQTLYNKMKKLQ
jgi:DNA-binding NtrC family response regulator